MNLLNFRSIIALIVGLLLISLVVEVVEFAIVTFQYGTIVTDETIYFGIRNQLPVLLAKMVYNTLGAILGGYVTAWIARKSEMLHGVALAVFQSATLVLGMTNTQYSHFTPTWVWLALFIITIPAIVLGAWIRQQRKPKI